MHRSLRTRTATAVAALLAVVAVVAVPAAAGPPFTADEYRGEHATLGTDGAVWFAQDNGEVLTRTDPATAARQTFSVPGATVVDLAPGIGGDAVWAASGRRIARVRTDGAATWIDLPPDTYASTIEPGPDGRMWFLGFRRTSPDSSIDPLTGTVDAAGAIIVRDAPDLPDGATVSASLGHGPGGVLWATLPFADLVVRLDADGSVRSFPLGPNPLGAPVAGPDGRLWVLAGQAVVRLDDAGQVLGRSPVPLLFGTAFGEYDAGLAVDGDAVWVGGQGGVVRFDRDATHPLPVLDPDVVRPVELVPAGGRLWFNGGHLDLDRRFVQVEFHATGSGGQLQLVADVRDGVDGPPVDGGTVTFEALAGSHHGFPIITTAGSAPVVDGRAAVTVTSQPSITQYRARYGGSSAFAANSTPFVNQVEQATGWRRYVQGAYRALLGRDGDEPGIAYWTGVLDRTNSPATFTVAVTGGVEWRRLTVEQTYRDVLGREADLPGRDFFVGVLDRGKRLAEVAATLAGAELVSRGDDAAWVEAAYQVLLGRSADDAGRRYLLDQLASGRSRVGAAGVLAASPEAFGRFVDGTYQILLGRAPDAGGRAYWVARLVGGDVEAELVAAIAATGEGQLRLTQHVGA